MKRGHLVRMHQQWLRPVFLILVALLIGGGIFGGVKVYGQVPPATTICIIIPAVCQPAQNNTEAGYNIIKTGPSQASPNDIITFNITITENLVSPGTVYRPSRIDIEDMYNKDMFTYISTTIPNAPSQPTIGSSDATINGYIDNIDFSSGPKIYEIKVKVNSSMCNNPATLVNRARIYWTSLSGTVTSVSSPSTSTLLINCPLPINIQGDVGAAGINTASPNIAGSRLKIVGPAVAVASGSVSLTSPGGTDSLTTILNGYNFSGTFTKNLSYDGLSDIKKIVDRVYAGSNNYIGTSNLMNGTNIPTAWHKGTASLSFIGSSWTGTGTFILKEDVNIGEYFRGSNDGAMGIIVLGTHNVNISAGVSAPNSPTLVKNVGIYAPESIVTISGNKINWTGFIIAKEIKINGLNNGGTISWSGQFAKNPPPGFGDIVKFISVSEKAPE